MGTIKRSEGYVYIISLKVPIVVSLKIMDLKFTLKEREERGIRFLKMEEESSNVKR